MESGLMPSGKSLGIWQPKERGKAELEDRSRRSTLKAISSSSVKLAALGVSMELAPFVGYKGIMRNIRDDAAAYYAAHRLAQDIAERRGPLRLILVPVGCSAYEVLVQVEMGVAEAGGEAGREWTSGRAVG